MNGTPEARAAAAPPRPSGARVALALVLGASACQDPLLDPAVVLGPRVVGARVRADEEPARAEPRSGEGASIDWLVLSDVAGPFAARVAWCRALPSSLGAPRCDGPPLAEASASGSYGRELSFAFQVPAGIEPGGAWLAWLGVCAGGEPAFDAEAGAFACPLGEALSALYRGFIPSAPGNRNPSLGDDLLVLDGLAWPGPESGAAPERAPREPCRGAPLPSLVAGVPSRIAFELGGDDREPLAAEPGDYAAHPRESLVYTHLASHPGLERAFSAIDYDAERGGFELVFDSDDAAPGPDGETLLFHLLVRDERGGVDWLRREACLLPPEL